MKITGKDIKKSINNNNNNNILINLERETGIRRDSYELKMETKKLKYEYKKFLSQYRILEKEMTQFSKELKKSKEEVMTYNKIKYNLEKFSKFKNQSISLRNQLKDVINDVEINKNDKTHIKLSQQVNKLYDDLTGLINFCQRSYDSIVNLIEQDKEFLQSFQRHNPELVKNSLNSQSPQNSQRENSNNSTNKGRKDSSKKKEDKKNDK